MGLIDKLPCKKERSIGMVRGTFFYGVFLHDLPRFDIRKYAWFSFSVFTLGYLCIFTITNMRLKTPFIGKISMFKTSISSLMCLMVLLTTYFKRRDIVSLIEDIERGFYTYSDEFRFKYKFSVPRKAEQRFINTWAAIIFISWIVAVFSLPFILMLKGKFFKKTSKSMLLTWLPWKRDTVLKFYLGHFTLLAFTIPVATTLTGSTMFILTIYFEFHDQFERLAYALSTAVELAERQKVALPGFELISSQENVLKVSANTNRAVDLKIIECITHYRILLKSFTKIKTWFEIVYAMVLIHSLLTLAMMSYGALINITNVEITSFYINIIFLYTGQLYGFCYTGQQFFVINEELASSIYSLPWYRLSSGSRKMMYVFLCQVQRPFYIMALKIYPASFSIFSNIMKLSYSYFNLLRTYGSSIRRD